MSYRIFYSHAWEQSESVWDRQKERNRKETEHMKANERLFDMFTEA